jgi:type II secretory pathway component PulK
MMVRDHAMRRGFALIAVLGAVIAAGTIAMIAMRTVRNVLLTSSNRTNLIRARWSAYGCVERARAAFAESRASTMARGSEWVRLDTVLSESWLLREPSLCALSIEAAGDRMDVNGADASQLRAVAVAAGAQPLQADSLVEALLDWRDNDDDARPLGAEQLWYKDQNLETPRNQRFGSHEELALVRGFARHPYVTALLGVETGRPSLTRAPRAVLASLPGFTLELVDFVLEKRTRGLFSADLNAMSATLSDSNRRVLLSAQEKLQGQLVLEPDAWILLSRARPKGAAVTAVVEARIGREGNSSVVLRLREWWE